MGKLGTGRRDTARNVLLAEKGVSYRKLRNEILRRDCYTCQLCISEECGKRLEVMHLIAFHERPDLYADRDNMLTVCVECHCAYDGMKLYKDTLQQAKDKTAGVWEQLAKMGIYELLLS